MPSQKPIPALLLLCSLCFSQTINSSNDSLLLPQKHYLCINTEFFFAPVSLHANSVEPNYDFFDFRFGLFYSFPTRSKIFRINVGLQYSFFDEKYRSSSYTSTTVYEGESAIVKGRYPDKRRTFILDIEHIIKRKRYLFGYGVSGNLGFSTGDWYGNIISVNTNDTLHSWNRKTTTAECFNLRIKILPFGFSFWRLTTQLYVEGNIIDVYGTEDFKGIDPGIGIRFSMPIELYRKIKKRNKKKAEDI